MESTTAKKTRPATVIGGGLLALVACAACCAGPILAVLGGLSVASLAGAIWVPALALVAVAALAGIVWPLVGVGAATAARPQRGPSSSACQPPLRSSAIGRHLSRDSTFSTVFTMGIAKSVVLFVLAALAEIGGAWLIWQGWRQHRGVLWIAGGIVALGAYGFVATFQPDPNFGRILAAYGGIFVAGSLAWGMVIDKFRPDRYDVTGAVICLIGVAIIMYAPRST